MSKSKIMDQIETGVVDGFVIVGAVCFILFFVVLFDVMEPKRTSAKIQAYSVSTGHYHVLHTESDGTLKIAGLRVYPTDDPNVVETSLGQKFILSYVPPMVY